LSNDGIVYGEEIRSYDTAKYSEKELIFMRGADILLVEDDEVLRTVVERNLQARGHCVNIATDVQSALSSLRARKFDLILLDINLPDQTGWDILRVALSEGRLDRWDHGALQGKLPVIVLSAVRVSPHRLAEFHPLAYLPKPFPMDALLRFAAEAAERSNIDTSSNCVDVAEQDGLPHAHPF
jgi:DNA-binding response OmpR family regulator